MFLYILYIIVTCTGLFWYASSSSAARTALITASVKAQSCAGNYKRDLMKAAINKLVATYFHTHCRGDGELKLLTPGL